MVRTKWLAPGEYSIAAEIFSNANVSLPESCEARQFLIVMDGRVPVSAGCLWVEDGHCRLSAATLPHMQNQGFGSLAVRLLIRKAFDSGYTQQFIKLATFHRSQAFFTSLGFAPSPEGMVHTGDISGNCNDTTAP